MSWYDNLDFTSNVLCISFDSTMSFGAFSKLQSWTVSDSTGCKGCKRLCQIPGKEKITLNFQVPDFLSGCHHKKAPKYTAFIFKP